MAYCSYFVCLLYSEYNDRITFLQFLILLSHTNNTKRFLVVRPINILIELNLHLFAQVVVRLALVVDTHLSFHDWNLLFKFICFVFQLDIIFKQLFHCFCCPWLCFCFQFHYLIDAHWHSLVNNLFWFVLLADILPIVHACKQICFIILSAGESTHCFWMLGSKVYMDEACWFRSRFI